MDDPVKKPLSLADAIELLRSQWKTGQADLRAIAQDMLAVNSDAWMALIEADVQERVRAGMPVAVEHYVHVFPQLQAHTVMLSQLLAKSSVRLTEAADVDSRESAVGMFSAASMEATQNFDSAGSRTGSNSGSSRQRLDGDEIPKTIGSFNIVRVIGRGGFGLVLEGRDSRLDRRVAIKIKHGTAEPGLSDDFLHEARSIVRLDHPSIVKLLQADETDAGVGYLVYEFVDGETLQEKIAKGNITMEQYVQWIASIAEALDYAHRRGIVHRDVSPRNIMITTADNALLLDFGLSSRDYQFHLDDKNRILGTPAYMSPEQAAGNPHWATAYADIFSLGSVLYHALTGKLAFAGSSTFDVLERIQKATPASPRSIRPDIPCKLEEACLRALAKEPQMRFSTGADMAAALLNSIAPAVRVEPVQTPIETKVKPNAGYLLWQLTIGAVLTLIGLTVAWIGWGPWNKPLESQAPPLIPFITDLDLELEKKDGSRVSLLYADGNKPLDLSEKPLLLLRTPSLNTNCAQLQIFNRDPGQLGTWTEHKITGDLTRITVRDLRPGLNVIFLAYASTKFDRPLSLNPDPVRVDQDLVDRDHAAPNSEPPSRIWIKGKRLDMGNKKIASDVLTRGAQEKKVTQTKLASVDELRDNWNTSAIYFEVPGNEQYAYSFMAFWAEAGVAGP